MPSNKKKTKKWNQKYYANLRSRGFVYKTLRIPLKDVERVEKYIKRLNDRELVRRMLL